MPDEKINSSDLVCLCNTRMPISGGRIQENKNHDDTYYYNVPHIPDCYYNSYECRCVSRFASCTCAERTYQSWYQVNNSSFYTTSLCDVHEIRETTFSNCETVTYSHCDCRMREFTDNEGNVGYRTECVEVVRDCECNGRTITGLINRMLLPYYKNSLGADSSTRCTKTNLYTNYIKSYDDRIGNNLLDVSNNIEEQATNSVTNNSIFWCVCQYRQKAFKNPDVHFVSDRGNCNNYNYNEPHTYFAKNYNRLNMYTHYNHYDLTDKYEDCLCKERSLWTKSYLSTDCNCVSREVYNTNECQNDACFCNVQAHICDCQKRTMLENCPCNMRQYGDVCTCNEKNGKKEYGYCDCDFRLSENKEYEKVKMGDCTCFNRAFPEISCKCDARNTACYLHVFIDSSYAPFGSVSRELSQEEDYYTTNIIAHIKNPGYTNSFASDFSAVNSTFSCDCNARDYMNDKREPYDCLCFFKSVVSEYAKVKFLPINPDYTSQYDYTYVQYYVEQEPIDPEKVYATKIEYIDQKGKPASYNKMDAIFSVLIDENIANKDYKIKMSGTYPISMNNIVAMDIANNDLNPLQVYSFTSESNGILYYVDCTTVYDIKNYNNSSLTFTRNNNCTSNKCDRVYLNYKIYNDPFIYEKSNQNYSYYSVCTTVNAIDNVPEGCDYFVSKYSSINPCNYNQCQTVYRIKKDNYYSVSIATNQFHHLKAIDRNNMEKYPILISGECVCKSRYILDGNDDNDYESIYSDTLLYAPFATTGYKNYRYTRYSSYYTTLCECQIRTASCDCDLRTSCGCVSRNDAGDSTDICICKNRNVEKIPNTMKVEPVCDINYNLAADVCETNFHVKCLTRTGDSCRIVEFCRCNLRKSTTTCIEKQSVCNRYDGLSCEKDYSISLDCLTNEVGVCPKTAIPTKHECPYNILGCSGRWTANTRCYAQGSIPDCECNTTTSCYCNFDKNDPSTFCKCHDRSWLQCNGQLILQYPNRPICTCDIQTGVCTCVSRTDDKCVCQDKYGKLPELDDCICNFKYKSCECRGRCTSNLKTDFFVAGEDVSHVTNPDALKPNPTDPNDI